MKTQIHKEDSTKLLKKISGLFAYCKPGNNKNTIFYNANK